MISCTMGAPVFARITQAANIKPVLAAAPKAPIALTPIAVATGFGASKVTTPATASAPAASVPAVQQSFAVKALSPVKQTVPSSGMSGGEIAAIAGGVLVLGLGAFFLLK